MTGKQLQKMLDKAEISQVGLARLLDMNDRQVRRYVAGDAEIPRTVEIAARCLLEHGNHTETAK